MIRPQLRSFSTFLAVSAALLFTVSSVGCKKSGEGEKGSSGSAEAQVSSVLSHLPKDSTMVFGMSVERALKAKMLQPLLEKARADVPPEFAKVKEVCGIDMMDGAIRSVTAAMKDPEDQKTVFAALTTSFSKKEMNECVTKMGGKVEEKGKIVVYTDGEGKPITGYWAEDNLLIVNPTDDATEADYAPVFEGGLDKNTELNALMKDTNTGAVVWFAGMLPAEAGSAMPGAEKMRLSIDGDTKVDINAAMIFADAEKAATAKAGLEEQMGMAGMILGAAAQKIKVGNEGTAVTITADFTEEDVKQITTSLQGAMKMMGK